jgi:hypothetical protein
MLKLSSNVDECKPLNSGGGGDRGGSGGNGGGGDWGGEIEDTVHELKVRRCRLTLSNPR